jgi:hypothetical protein
MCRCIKLPVSIASFWGSLILAVASNSWVNEQVTKQSWRALVEQVIAQNFLVNEGDI